MDLLRLYHVENIRTQNNNNSASLAILIPHVTQKKAVGYKITESNKKKKESKTFPEFCGTLSHTYIHILRSFTRALESEKTSVNANIRQVEVTPTDYVQHPKTKSETLEPKTHTF